MYQWSQDAIKHIMAWWFFRITSFGELGSDVSPSNQPRVSYVFKLLAGITLPHLVDFLPLEQKGTLVLRQRTGFCFLAHYGLGGDTVQFSFTELNPLVHYCISVVRRLEETVGVMERAWLLESERFGFECWITMWEQPLRGLGSSSTNPAGFCEV